MSATYDVGGNDIVDLVWHEALEDARIVVVIRILCAAPGGQIVTWEHRDCRDG